MTYQNDVTPAWQNYVDVANDVKRWLQIPATDTTRDNDLQDLVDTACWWVQDYLGRPIAPTQFFRRFSGYQGLNGAHISLPYYPILTQEQGYSIAVVEYWGANGPQTLTEQTPANQGAQQMFTMDPLRGVLTRSFMGLVQRPWFPGLRNIEVTWWAGYNPVPPTVRMATREYIKYWWGNTQQAARPTTLRGSYGDEDAFHPTFDNWPGVEAKIKQLLQPFTQVGLG